MTRSWLASLVAVALAAPAAFAADPDCKQRCRDMAARGELRAGVNEKGCVTRV